MAKEFKMSVGYRHYMLNLLVKNDSTLVEVSLVGMLVGDEYEILEESVGKVLHIIDFGKILQTPRDAQIAFSNFIADGGGAILDQKIMGEPEPEVEPEPKATPKPAPKKRTTSRKKKA